MKTKEVNSSKKPIVSATVNLFYTKGLYEFFCKTTAIVFQVIMGILTKAKLTKNDFITLVRNIWIVNHMSLKLEGICSISTSVHDNCFCKAFRKIADCICKYCYAYNQQCRHTGLKEHNILNGFILRNVLIPVQAFKALVFVFPYLRIESFGDCANVIQARNYLRIIKAFPKMRCAIWSKNLAIWEQAINEEGKPKNCTFVYSSPKLNEQAKIDREKYWFVDHVFTVFTKEYIKANNITINCGGRKCMECIKRKINCYFRNTEFFINEEKK